MTKKMWSLLLTGALITGVFSAVPAQAAPEVPATVNIEDPAGDSNGLNDQNDGSSFGDNPGGVYFGAADILKVWFTTTDKLNVHVQTSTAGGGGNWAINYRIFANDNCTAFQGSVSGKSNGDAENSAIIRDFCGDLENVDGEINVETLADETGLTTLSFPLGSWPGVELGSTLVGPNARTRLILGVATVPQVDTTVVGTDYTISAGGAPTQPPVAEEPPGKNDPPGQGNQNCSKIKNKKKKKECKKNNGKTPPGEKCAAYTPGEAGAEAETLVVTDAATEEAPLELEVETVDGAGIGRGTFGPFVSHSYVNLQVDSSTATGGLWVKVSFAAYQDYDLYLDPADGSGEVASAGGFGPEQDGEPGDSQSDIGSETLTGIRTDDCGGWTLDIAGATTEGGTVTLTTWLGAELWDPASQAPVGAKAFVF